MINKVVKRSLKRDRGIFIAINVMIFITIFLLVISVLSYTVGYKSTQTYKEEVNLEDFQMQTIQQLSEEQIKNLEQDYNLDIQEEDKYLYDENNKQITIYNRQDNADISKVKILEGSSKVNDGEIILSESYATANNLKVNDKITINNQELEIVGLSFFPEDIYPAKEGSLFPVNEDVAIGFVNDSTFDKVASPSKVSILYRGKFNEKPQSKSKVYKNIKEDLTIQTAQTNIVGEVVEPINYVDQSNVISLVDYIKNFNIGIIELEYEFVSVIMFGMSILIGIITIILSVFLFKSVVQKQRREIGILRAFGIYKQEIVNEYSKVFTISIIITAVIGIIVGGFAYYGLSILYEQFFNFVSYPIDPIAPVVLLVIVIVVALILILCVRYISIKRNLTISILNMIKNTEVKKEKVKQSKFRFKKFKTNLKINIITRNSGKTMLLVYGIIFSTFLLVFALCMISAVKNMQDNIYGDEFTYQYEAVFSPTFEPDAKLYNSESIIYFPANIKGESEDIISVVGYDVDNETININNDVQLNKNEVYVSTALADKYNIKQEDEITINNISNEDEQYIFKVKEIADNQAEEKIYADINYVQKELNLSDNYYNGYVGKSKTKKEISQGDVNMIYYSPDDTIKGMNEYSQMVNVAIVGIALFAFTISLIALSVVTNIIIKNNEKIISIMKVLGYSSKEINNLIISGYRPIVIIAFLIAFPLSAIGAKFYMQFITSLIDGLNYPLVLKPNLTIFIISFIIIILSFEVTLFITKRKINKISLSKALNIDE